MQQCNISMCPTGELIALVHGRRLVVLSAKWDSSNSLAHFQVTYTGTPEENDVIKAVLCLPITGQSQSSHVSASFIVTSFLRTILKFVLCSILTIIFLMED